MTLVARYAVDAITLASLYAILALGIALIFGIMRLINFAHGELIMIGSYTIFYLGHLPLPIIIAGSLVVVIVFALAMERIAFRPVRNADQATLLVTSFAVSYLLQHLVVLFLGVNPKSTAFLSNLNAPLTIGSVLVPKLDIATITCTTVLLISLVAFFKRTAVGVQMRAAAEDFQMSRLLGVYANRIIALAFVLSGALAAIASILIVAQTGTLYPAMGVSFVLPAFVATVVGGMGSLTGAVAGASLLGVGSVALQALLPVGVRPFRDAFVYAAVLGFLVLRPQGLIIVRSAKERV